MIFAFLQAAEQGQAVHPWHVDVAQEHVDVWMVSSFASAFTPSSAKLKLN